MICVYVVILIAFRIPHCTERAVNYLLGVGDSHLHEMADPVIKSNKQLIIGPV